LRIKEQETRLTLHEHDDDDDDDDDDDFDITMCKIIKKPFLGIPKHFSYRDD